MNHEEEDHKSSVKYANTFALYALGFTIVIGGQVFSWNVSLQAGVWEAFAGFLLTSVGYICLVLCLAEMTSALPFSGGSYGFVRVCIGPFFGYCIGCCETLQNIAYTISAVIPFAQMLTTVFQEPSRVEPGYWVLFFVVAMGINIAGGKIFWYFNNAIGMVSLALVIIYIVSTAQYCDFDKFANPSSSFDMMKFLKYLPLASWFFIGIEAVPLACVDCEKPSVQIPWAMVACVLTLFLTGIGVFFTSVSQAPGIEEVGDSLLPLNFGYNRVFNMSHTTSTWLAIPATFATGFGFMFVYGRQMNAMARSGLFPEVFKNRTSFSKTPYSALIFGSFLAIIGIIIVYFYDLSLLDVIFRICVLASYTIYVFVFWSYFTFTKRYSNVPRAFKNPFGIITAVIGMLVFLLGLITVLGFSDDNVAPIVVFSIFIAILIIYYYFYGYQTQKLSEEEHKILFKAYVINANKMKKRGTSSASNSAVHTSVRRAKKAFRSAVDSSPFLQYVFGSLKDDDNNAVSGVNSSASSRQQQQQQRNGSSASARSKSQDNVLKHQVTPILEEPAQTTTESLAVLSHALHATTPAVSTHQPAVTREVSKDDELDRKNSPHTVLPTRTASHQFTENNTLLGENNDESPAEMMLMSSQRQQEDKEAMQHENAGDIEANEQAAKFHNRSQKGISTSKKDHSLQFLRKSFLGSFSEKLKEIASEIKLIPLMNEQERNEYESVVLAEYRGDLQVVEDKAEDEKRHGENADPPHPQHPHNHHFLQFGHNQVLPLNIVP